VLYKEKPTSLKYNDLNRFIYFHILLRFFFGKNKSRNLLTSSLRGRKIQLKGNIYNNHIVLSFAVTKKPRHYKNVSKSINFRKKVCLFPVSGTSIFNSFYWS
jgi:hypothetical protein